MTDAELLQRYARDGCEASFSELVQRHVGLVFSAALRQLGGDRHLAEDVTQSVFTDLAHKAPSLSEREVISGWLYTSVRFAAAKSVRTEQRRRVREEKAFDMIDGAAEEKSPDWEQLQPVLDEAMHQLKSADRDALVLRFFEGKPLAEVGSLLGVSADGARMRLERALGKLRKCLQRKGVTTSAAALAVLLAQQTSAAVPVGFAATVAGAAISSAAQAASAATLFEIIVMSKLKAAALAALVVGVSVPLVVQHRANLALQNTNSDLAGKISKLENQITPLASENTRLSNILARVNETNRGDAELLRLRAEVARFRAEPPRVTASANQAKSPQDPLQRTLLTLGERAAKLRTRLEQSPEKHIPELAFLSEKDWLDAVSNLDNLESDEDYRQAMNNLRSRGKNIFGNQLKDALQKFADANDGLLPTDLSQLQPFFTKASDPAALQRYKLVQAGRLDDVPRDQSIIDEVAPPVDDEYETYFRFHRQGTTSRSYSQIGADIEKAAVQFANANQGMLPQEPAQLTAYLQQPVDQTRLQKFLSKIPPSVKTLQEYQARH